MNRIEFLNFGLPIFPQMDNTPKTNLESIIKSQKMKDIQQQDITPVNIPVVKSGQLPEFTDTDFINNDTRQPKDIINRNMFVFGSQVKGEMTPQLKEYRKQYGIFNPSQLNMERISKPQILTSANRTDILFNKTIDKLFDRSVLPYSNIII